MNPDNIPAEKDRVQIHAVRDIKVGIGQTKSDLAKVRPSLIYSCLAQVCPIDLLQAYFSGLASPLYKLGVT